MRFTDSPLRLEKNGWLAQAASPEEAIIKLLNIMATTPENGWYGSKSFGLREALANIRAKEGTRIAVLQRLNQSLLELGIDWVKVAQIEPEPGGEFGSQNYLFTLAYAGRGTETHRVTVK